MATTEDPIRAEVERVLNVLVDLTVRRPARLATAVPRCLLRRASNVGPLAEPARVVRSVVDLLGAGATKGVVTPDDAAPAQAPSLADAIDAVEGAVVVPSTSASVPGDTGLPIEDYRSLAASQVVDRLAALGPAELRSVRDFEEAHRGRRTILGRIDQLLG